VGSVKRCRFVSLHGAPNFLGIHDVVPSNKKRLSNPGRTKNGLTTHPRAPRETHDMSTEIDEDDVIGPTIWEAAAEEEIQENFWCVGPPREILSQPRNAQ